MEPLEARKLVSTFEVAVERYIEIVDDPQSSMRLRQAHRVALQEAREALMNALINKIPAKPYYPKLGVHLQKPLSPENEWITLT